MRFNFVRLYHVIALMVFLLMSQSVKSQHTYIKDRVQNLNEIYPSKISFGLYLGINSYNLSLSMKESFYEHHAKSRIDPEDLIDFLREKEYNFTDYPDHPYNSVLVDKPKPRAIPFNIGGFIKYRLNNYFQVSFEPGFFFGENYNLIFWDYLFDDFEEPISPYYKGVSSIDNIISLPVSIEFGLNRVNNMRPYLLTGISVNINLNPEFQDLVEKKIRISEFQLKEIFVNYEVGLGVDFLLYKFRLTPSIRWSFSSSDLLERILDPVPDYLSEVRSLQNVVFLINLAVSPN